MKLRMSVALMLVLPALLYLPFIGNQFVTLDDNFLITHNERVKEFDPSILWSYDPELYVPLTLFTYQVDKVLLGGSSTVVHLTSLILHLLTTYVLFLVLSLLRFNNTQALIGALIFGLHPLQVEAVAWASGRKEVLFTLLFLLSIYYYLDSSNKKSLVAHALALLAKVTAVTLPVVLLAIDLKEQGRITLNSIKQKWVYFALSITLGIIALFGKSSDLVLNPLETGLLAARSTWFYLVKFIYPTNLAALHPITDAIKFTNLAYGGTLVGVVILTVVLIKLRRKLSSATLGYAVFLISLAPSLMGYSKAGQFQLASEHYMYLPIVGLIIVLLSFINLFRSKRIAYLLLLAWISCLAIVSHQRLQDWRNSETLYLRVLQVHTDSHVAANNLATVYLNEGNTEGAIVYLNKAIEWKPNFAKPYANLSEALRRKGDFIGAQQASLKALELKPSIFEESETDVIKADDIDQAIALLKQQVQKNPANGDLWWELGVLYGQMELYLEGVKAFQKAAALDPSRQEQAAQLKRILEQIGE